MHKERQVSLSIDRYIICEDLQVVGKQKELKGNLGMMKCPKSQI